MRKLYKVLVDGKSCHGGSLAWDLPRKEGKKWIPGKWHEHKGNITICEKGLHLTTERFNWYKWGCTAYEAEAKDIVSWQDDKCVARSVRLLKPVPHPKWWTDCEGWIATLKAIAWLKPDGKPKKEWKLFETRDAARDAAGDAARDAALYVQTAYVCSGLKLESRHRVHARKRMEVWQKGYGLYAEVNGILYVYKKI